MEGRDAKYVVSILKSASRKRVLKGMGRFGIVTGNALGVSVPKIREIARKLGKDHGLAQRLWASKIHEAMILASMIDDPLLVTGKQMDGWVQQFDSWDLCDHCCGNLFDKTKHAYEKAMEWSGKDAEYVKRAGFVMMACLAVHDKKRGDKDFIRFLKAIERESGDERNFVKKAVNWALRQIGKRNTALNVRALSSCKRIRESGSRSALWIASDATRELSSKAVRVRLNGH